MSMNTRTVCAPNTRSSATTGLHVNTSGLSAVGWKHVSQVTTLFVMSCTMALGNPEHPGRTRGTPGSVPWKVGFPDAGGYKSHEMRKKVQQTQMQALQARVQAIEEREANRSKRTAEASPVATPPSQRRSSVASTKLLQP